MQIAAQVIFFNYKMMDSRGVLIEASQKEPLSIISGKSHTFKPIENAALKMKKGESKRIPVRSKDAFGDYNEDLVLQVPKSKFESSPKIGDTFEMELEDGSIIKMKMADEKDDVCILDGNHSLAGIDLLFEIEIISRREATAHEIKTGKIKN